MNVVYKLEQEEYDEVRSDSVEFEKYLNRKNGGKYSAWELVNDYETSCCHELYEKLNTFIEHCEAVAGWTDQDMLTVIHHQAVGIDDLEVRYVMIEAAIDIFAGRGEL